MIKYLIDYRDSDYKPRVLMVEATGKKDALRIAKEQLTADDYIVPKPRRAFISNK